MQSRKTWVFDLDGTLVDSFAVYLEFVREKFALSGLRLSAEEEARCVGLPAGKFFETHFAAETAKTHLRELRSLNASNLQHIQPFPGALSLLKKLKESGRKVAVWTSRDFNSARELMEKTGIAPWIDHVVSGCCVTKHKPHTEGIEKIAAYFNCDFSDLVFVGDHDFDMQAAKSSGAYAVRACWHGFNVPESCDLSDLMSYSIQSLEDRLT